MKLHDLLIEKSANLYPRKWNPSLGKKGLWQYDHRSKLEKKLGKKLKPNEIVHHKDGDETNCSLKNLQIVTRSEHAVLEKPAKKYDGCKVPNCKRPHHAKGYCHYHYVKLIKK